MRGRVAYCVRACRCGCVRLRVGEGGRARACWCVCARVRVWVLVFIYFIILHFFGGGFLYILDFCFFALLCFSLNFDGFSF